MTLVIKQYRTGGYETSNDFLFKVWEIPANLEGEDLEEIIEKGIKDKIDFIIQEKVGEIDFIHVSYKDLKNEINENGLIYDENNDWINDLGRGIYVIEEDNEEALDNLYSYVENHEEEELLLVKGTFTGTYYECVHGESHEHYICIKENISADFLSTEIIFVNDFLFN